MWERKFTTEAGATHRVWRTWGVTVGTAVVLAMVGCAQPPSVQSTHHRAHDVQPGVVSVTYADPTRFHREPGGPLESVAARKAWLNQLSEHLADRLADVLPAGQKAQVHITDLRRAGTWEAARQGTPVRVVRDGFPPQVTLRFELRDAQGKMVRVGERSFVDIAFMLRQQRYPQDPMGYEKSMLDQWVTQEFKA